MIEARMIPFRSRMAHKAVKKTLTIPKWLDDLAAEANVNYSQTLQDALKAQLGIVEYTAKSPSNRAVADAGWGKQMFQEGEVEEAFLRGSLGE